MAITLDKVILIEVKAPGPVVVVIAVMSSFLTPVLARIE